MSSHSDFKPFVRTLSDKLQEYGVSTRVDDSGASIGKRYSVGLLNSMLASYVSLTECSATTSLVPPWASPSTSSLSRITHLHCETVTRQNRSAPVSMRSLPPSRTSSAVRSNGQTLLRACPNLKVRRSMPKSHDQEHEDMEISDRRRENSWVNIPLNSHGRCTSERVQAIC